MTRGSTHASRSTSPTASPSFSALRGDSPPSRRSTLLLALPAVVGAVVLLAVTRRGAYLSPDSLAYVGMARNLLDGHGFTPPPGSPPLGNFAPLYSLVLAAIGALGPDPLTVARFVGPLAFGGTILVVGLLARRLSGSMPLALGAQLLVLAGTDLLLYHSSALSEPLFLLLAFSTVAVLWRCLDERSRPGLLAVAGALAAATCLTRYVGLAVVAASVVGLVLVAKRYKDALVFAAVALTPLLGWFVWLLRTEGRASNRSAVLHFPGVSYVTTGLRSAGAWLLPDSAARLLGGVATIVLVAVIVVVAWRRPPRSDPSATAGVELIALFGAFYLGALVADRLLFDVTGRLDARFMLVLHVVAILVAVWLLRDVDLTGSRLAQIGLAAIVGLQLVRGAVWLGEAVPDSTTRLGGFAAPAWVDSAILDHVRARPPSVPVYSNEPDVVWFLTGRVATLVPEKKALLTGRANPNYEAELAAMVTGLEQGGVLVYFTEVPARRVFLPTAEELGTQLDLAEVARDQTGVVYRRI